MHAHAVQTHSLNLHALIAFNLGVAGSDLTWMHGEDGKGIHGKRTHCLSAAPRRGLAAFLFAHQNGTCVQHGEACQDDPQNMVLCHLIPRGNRWEYDPVTGDHVLVGITNRGQGRGWTPGNIFLACRAANQAHKSEPRGIANPANMARPDLIALDWPTIPALTRWGATI